MTTLGSTTWRTEYHVEIADSYGNKAMIGPFADSAHAEKVRETFRGPTTAAESVRVVATAASFTPRPAGDEDNVRRIVREELRAAARTRASRSL